MIKKVLLNDIVAFLSDSLLKIEGEHNNEYVDNVADIEHTNATTLDWINPTKNDKQSIAEESIAKVVIVDESIVYTQILSEQKKTLLVVKNPKRELMRILKRFFVTEFVAGIDKTAFIHPEAKIGENNYIGPNCYIGKCIIGDNNIIHSNTCIYDRTVIGDNNVIHSGALICVDGLGCIREESGQLLEFPQMGGVQIGNACYIGGNTHIASGSLSDTIIENGCKINGLSFIGSNDHLHENVWITGSTMLAGSVVVEKNTTIYSRVVVREWIHIGKNVTIGMGSVVTKNVPDGETWIGTPAKKLEKK